MKGKHNETLDLTMRYRPQYSSTSDGDFSYSVGRVEGLTESDPGREKINIFNSSSTRVDWSLVTCRHYILRIVAGSTVLLPCTAESDP
jgi:hypothetical protein